MELRTFFYPEYVRPDLAHLVRRGGGFSPWTLDWNDLTLFKPVRPAASGDVDEEDEHNEHRWCIELPGLIRSAGVQHRFTFLDRPADWQAGLAVATPYRHLRQALLARLEAGDSPLTDLRHTDRGPALPKPRPWRAIQGTLYLRGNFNFMHAPRQCAVLLLPPSAWRSMQRLLAEPTMREALLDPNSPTLLSFHQAIWHCTAGPRWQVVHEVDRIIEGVGEGGMFGAGRFLARLVRPIDRRVAMIPPPGPVTPVFTPWANVFRQLTAQEQLTVLAAAFGRELTWQAYRGSPFESVLPAWVRGRS